jgi:hypothetical protein
MFHCEHWYFGGINGDCDERCEVSATRFFISLDGNYKIRCFCEMHGIHPDYQISCSPPWWIQFIVWFGIIFLRAPKDSKPTIGGTPKPLSQLWRVASDKEVSVLEVMRS